VHIKFWFENVKEREHSKDRGEDRIILELVLEKYGAEAAQSGSRLGYGLEDRGSIIGKRNDGTFSLRHRVQIGSGAHPASYPMGAGGSLPGVQVPGREATSI
jgi:hypothetical protein